jgi:hypothetical protein
VRGHLIRHPALPTADEDTGDAALAQALLPSYSGVMRDLPLNRAAPARFAVIGSPPPV